jgi:hypothetical protein
MRPRRMSEARTEDRLGRLEEDVREIKTTLAGLAPLINRIEATLTHLATKAELANLRTELVTALADKPGRGYLWGVMAAMVGALAVALAAAALIFAIVQLRWQPPTSAARLPAPPPAHASIVQPGGERLSGDAQLETGSPRQPGGLAPGARDSLAAVPARAASRAANAAAGVVRHHQRGGRPAAGLGSRAGERRTAAGIVRIGGDLRPVATRGQPSRTRAIRQAAVVGIWSPDGRIHYVPCWDIRTAGPPPYAIEPWARDPLVCPQ